MWPTVGYSCSAIIQLKKQMLDHSMTLSDLPEIHSFLDGFYLSRIGIRILIGQHISLHQEPREGYIGSINTQCDPVGVVQQAIGCVPCPPVLPTHCFRRSQLEQPFMLYTAAPDAFLSLSIMHCVPRMKAVVHCNDDARCAAVLLEACPCAGMQGIYALGSTAALQRLSLIHI